DHVGTGGAPLSVIATDIQRQVTLASDGSVNAERLLEKLSAEAEAAGAGGGLSGTREAGRQMKDAVLQMHSGSEMAYARVSEIAALSTDLSEKIRRLREGFSAGPRLAEGIASACAALERTAQTLPEDHGVATLDQVARSYTMRTEREIHRQSIEGNAETAEAEL